MTTELNSLPQNIIDKYNVPVPRYTSYPPANYFSTDFNADIYKNEVLRSNSQKPSSLSFYFHIPFCRRLCHYCGCNAYPMTSEKRMSDYIDAIHKEIDLVIPHIDKSRKISQIHYGGGTPTVLPLNILKEINQHLLENFGVSDNPEIAIECHPGWLDEEYWVGLKDCYFNRYSIGVQDFNETVLKCVNRRKPLIPVKDIIDILHKQGGRVNLDLLYGLPLQTPESFRDSVCKALECQPDRMVTFSYAHVPWVNKAQLILEKHGLPDTDTKSRIFEMARKEILSNNYIQVGMDHFVKKDDELALAMQNNELHRNFQGYCTLRTTGQVYAFGVTGISQLSTAYAQNTKDIDSYIEMVNSGILPVVKGYVLNHNEQVTRKVIDMLMCNDIIYFDKIADDFKISVPELKAILGYDEGKIRTFVNDGIISLSGDCIKMTEPGKIFVRNVASSFDSLLKQSPKSFSRPI